MDSIAVRCLFMEDHVWERTSESWKALIPLKDFNCRRDEDETPHQHYLRLRPRFNIPLEVIEQWLYPLYYDVRSVVNYGWLDYDRVSFYETSMEANELSNLTVLKGNRQYVRGRQAHTPFDGFTCSPQNIAYWQKNGTWRVPPIVLDISTLTDIPAYTEISGPYQLVEGHTRLGYLLAMLRTGMVAPESHHQVYMMRLQPLFNHHGRKS